MASSTSDPDGSNNTASASAAVTTRADLALTKSGPASALAGDAAGFDYSLTVTNQGPSDNVGGFTLSDMLPAGLTFEASGSDLACSAVGPTGDLQRRRAGPRRRPQLHDPRHPGGGGAGRQQPEQHRRRDQRRHDRRKSRQ